MLRTIKMVFLGFVGVVLVSGCAGRTTFNETARAGDTVAVATGYKKTFYRDTITVTITPESGAPVIINPADPSIRGVINLYPDVLASMHISVETNQDLTTSGLDYGTVIRNNFTGGDKDFWQTTVFIDLPPTLLPGLATVEVMTADEYHSSALNIIEGTGEAHSFTAESVEGSPDFPLSEVQISSMSRVPHYTIDFKKAQGVTNPHSIQITLAHDPDMDHGGAEGRAYAVNPRGDLKNISWADDGSTLTAMLFPAKDSKPIRVRDFKFYVAGGVTNLEVVNVEAFDDEGNLISEGNLTTGVYATSTATGM